MKTCVTCKQDFNPTSRHLSCPQCRSPKWRYNTCACGGKKAKTSAVCNTCFDASGHRNGNWKGGRTYHKKGYVMCRIDGTYKFEHVLVMEDILGRRLHPDENVHHKNGVRDDNRPENLELWVKAQPSGVRVEDAVAWAEQILSRYKEMVTSNNAQC